MLYGKRELVPIGLLARLLAGHRHRDLFLLYEHSKEGNGSGTLSFSLLSTGGLKLSQPLSGYFYPHLIGGTGDEHENSEKRVKRGTSVNCGTESKL